jgi:hypothetical protein
MSRFLRWTPEEDARLVELHAASASLDEMAQRLAPRTRKAIEAHIHDLRLTLGEEARQEANRLRVARATQKQAELALMRPEPIASNDAGHVRAVIRAGGFAAWSERPARNGHLIACRPLIPFRGAV